jgi:hypothetical protein
LSVKGALLRGSIEERGKSEGTGGEEDQSILQMCMKNNNKRKKR